MSTRPAAALKTCGRIALIANRVPSHRALSEGDGILCYLKC